jgi:hypothetical protein
MRIKPDIIEPVGILEVFADLAFVREHNGTRRILFCTERSPNASVVEAVLRIVMPDPGFIQSLEWANESDTVSGAMGLLQ